MTNDPLRDDPRDGIPNDHCPVCAHLLNAATAAEGEARPEEGDLSCCLYCRSFLVFTADLTLRKATEKEISELPHETRQILDHVRRVAGQVLQ